MIKCMLYVIYMIGDIQYIFNKIEIMLNYGLYATFPTYCYSVLEHVIKQAFKLNIFPLIDPLSFHAILTLAVTAPDPE